MTKPDNVYSPPQVGELTMAEIRRCIEWAKNDQTRRNVHLGWHEKQVKPLGPGKLCIIQAYTSNYKTGFMMNWAQRIAHEIKEVDRKDVYVAYVSWEDSVEDIGKFDASRETGIEVSDIDNGALTDAQVRKLEVATTLRGSLPLWVIGRSIANRRKQQPMTLKSVRQILEWVEDNMARQPVAVFLDYLNLIEPEDRRSFRQNRREDIMGLVFDSREMAFVMGCPVILAAQSNRSTNQQRWRLPQKWNGQESAALEQYSDTMLALWRPALDEPVGTTLIGPDNRSTDLEVTENLLIVGINKQKRGPAGGWFPLWINPATNEVQPMETRYEDTLEGTEDIVF